MELLNIDGLVHAVLIERYTYYNHVHVTLSNQPVVGVACIHLLRGVRRIFQFGRTLRFTHHR